MARLHLTVKGELGNIAFDSLTLVLAKSDSILRRFDRAVSGKEKGTMKWMVAGLKEGNSGTIEMRSRVISGDTDFGVQVGSRYIETIDHIETQGEAPPDYDLDMLRDLQAMTRAFGRNGVDGLSVSMPDYNKGALLSWKSDEILQNLTGVHYKTIGSVEGRVELVSLHDGNRYFNVYHAVTDRAVRCSLPEEREEAVIEDLKRKRRVVVSGEISYNVEGRLLSVSVDRYCRLWDGDKLPTLEDSLGVASDLTGNQNTEEYIRSLRDG